MIYILTFVHLKKHFANNSFFISNFFCYLCLIIT